MPPGRRWSGSDPASEPNGRNPSVVGRLARQRTIVSLRSMSRSAGIQWSSRLLRVSRIVRSASAAAGSCDASPASPSIASNVRWDNWLIRSGSYPASMSAGQSDLGASDRFEFLSTPARSGGRASADRRLQRAVGAGWSPTSPDTGRVAGRTRCRHRRSDRDASPARPRWPRQVGAGAAPAVGVVLLERSCPSPSSGRVERESGSLRGRRAARCDRRSWSPRQGRG